MTQSTISKKYLFNIGDRIETILNGIEPTERKYRGTIHHKNEDGWEISRIIYLDIKRDDGKFGGGRDGTWIIDITDETIKYVSRISGEWDSCENI